MDAKERWQALQAQLTRAQARLRAGDRAGALEAIDGALAIDPNFLAAHALRDRVIAQVGLISTPPPAAAEPQPPDAVRPLASPAGYAQFEQRARRRRVDRRVDAARVAIAEGRRKDAASAIDEIRELDQNLPELAELTSAFSAMAAPGRRRAFGGRWLAAAAVFGGIVLGATWLQESGALGSRSIVAIVPLVEPPQPLSVTLTAAEAETPAPALIAGTTGERFTPPTVPAPVARPIANPETVTASSTTAMNIPLVSLAVATPPPPPAAAPPVPPTFAPLASPVAAPPPASAAAAPARTVLLPDDEVLVQQTLQRYRTAYEGLDARSARAVWPAVNETALARAFDGLESQSLTFDACNVTLHGEAAAAVCRGKTRYIPKVGSREPRIEPRTWNFTLRKAGAGWSIESARAER